MYSEESILIEQLESTKGSKIAFWGASVFLKKFIKNNDLTNYNIVGIIDSDVEKVGTYHEGFQIFEYKNILKDVDYIIFTVRNNHNKIYNEVLDFLSREGISQKLLSNLFEDSKVLKLASNKIFLVNNGKRHQISSLPGLIVKWSGQNAILEIESNPIPRFENFEIECGTDCRVFIGSTQYSLKNVMASIPFLNSKLTIGKGCSIGGVTIIYAEKNSTISIGNDCMFSNGISIRTSDAHTIFDSNTEEVINKGGDIVIGDRVWICQNTTILKNTEIKNDTVIGASSLVNKKFEESNVIIAGNPARVVKRNIKWDRNTPDFFDL